MRGTRRWTAVRPKYGNRKVEWNGQKFDSQRELRCWQGLEQERLKGVWRAVIRQVSLPLPSSTRRIRVDFLCIDPEGKYHWFDAKGFETAAWKLKRDTVRTAYGIEVELL